MDAGQNRPGAAMALRDAGGVRQDFFPRSAIPLSPLAARADRRRPAMTSRTGAKQIGPRPVTRGMRSPIWPCGPGRTMPRRRESSANSILGGRPCAAALPDDPLHPQRPFERAHRLAPETKIAALARVSGIGHAAALAPDPQNAR